VVNWQYPVEMRATPTLAGGLQGIQLSLDNISTAYYNAGNNYAKIGDGTSPATASAEL
jgi:hypothetical protein